MLRLREAFLKQAMSENKAAIEERKKVTQKKKITPKVNASQIKEERGHIEEGNKSED